MLFLEIEQALVKYVDYCHCRLMYQDDTINMFNSIVSMEFVLYLRLIGGNQYRTPDFNRFSPHPPFTLIPYSPVTFLDATEVTNIYVSRRFLFVTSEHLA